jgi:L-alanine-DL-glutamate epimerase-like enolase superfamily enzyme
MKRRTFLKGAGSVAFAPMVFVPRLFGRTRRGTGMKLRYEVKRLDLKHTWTIARGSSQFKQNVIVRVEKDGFVGYGEAAPNIRYNETVESTVAVIEKAIPLFEKAEPWHYVDLGQAIQELAEEQTAAKAALDIALMDWVTKAAGLPFYRFLGLDKKKTPITTMSIGIDTPEVIQQKVREAADFPVLKIKVGLKNDEEIIAAVRAVTEKPLRVDANEGWKSKEEALEKIRWLVSQGVEFVEQPLPSTMLEETRWLRDRVEIPIIADESVKRASDIPKLAEAFDGVNIKLMKAGGLQEALRMIWMARSLGMKIMLGCMIETSVAISAAASISPLVDFADLDGNLLITNDPFDGVKVRRGKLLLTDRPGIGVVPRA